eukprot:15333155-Ditylum_brightwellii.AAC.1
MELSLASKMVSNWAQITASKMALSWAQMTASSLVSKMASSWAQMTAMSSYYNGIKLLRQ